jgi:predicted ester cyclase
VIEDRRRSVAAAALVRDARSGHYVRAGGVFGCSESTARRFEEADMTPDEMLTVYRQHRAVEDAHDFPAVLKTLTPDCFLEQVSLGLRSVGRAEAERAYEDWFGAFPDLGPIPEGLAFGDDVLVAYGQLHGTMSGPWLGLEPTGKSFTVPLVNIVPFKDGLMHGERIFYDAVMFSDQVGLDVRRLLEAARNTAIG